MPTHFSDISLRKKILMFLLWLVCGVLSWYVAVFVSTFVVSPFLARWVIIPGGMPFSREILAITDVLIFSAGDYITAFFATTTLCYLTGYERLWLIGFIVGVDGYPLYDNFVSLSAYLDVYPGLPSWVIRWWFQDLVPIVIVVPLVAWAGCMAGRKLGLRRTT